MTERELREKAVQIAQSMIGCNEADGSHRKIIDTYNSMRPLPRSYAVRYTDAWCATFVSVVSQKAGLTDIMPRECGCGKMIELYINLGRWNENDAHVPSAGDVIFYDWEDNGIGDDQGAADHVGIVESCDGSTITVIEGNKSNAVGRRKLPVNGRYIRGFGLPNYASKATTAAQTKEDPRRNAGRGLSRTPMWVGAATVDDLNVRKWAGTEYDNLVSYPKLNKGNLVDVCDSVKANDGSTWHYIRIAGKTFGFVHSAYIEKTTDQEQQPTPIKTEVAKSFNIGDKVRFTGNTHFTSSYSGATGKSAKACDAKITNTNMKGAHPYHVVGSGVHGWVDAKDIEG